MLVDVSGTRNHHSYPTEGGEPAVTPNIDMFMACCDWEAAIEEERESSQEDLNDLQDNQPPLLSQELNEITEADKAKMTTGIVNHSKSSKRKLKLDLKNRNTIEMIKNKHKDILQTATEEQEIDIDSMMKRTPPNEASRRAQKRVLPHRGKRRSPSKKRYPRPEQSNNCSNSQS